MMIEFYFSDDSFNIATVHLVLLSAPTTVCLFLKTDMPIKEDLATTREQITER